VTAAHRHFKRLQGNRPGCCLRARRGSAVHAVTAGGPTFAFDQVTATLRRLSGRPFNFHMDGVSGFTKRTRSAFELDNDANLQGRSGWPARPRLLS
jgi:hypothetical protein